MSKAEIILALGNALIMLNGVETHGEKNLNDLLGGIQQVRKAYKSLKETREDNEHEDDNEQRENV